MDTHSHSDQPTHNSTSVRVKNYFFSQSFRATLGLMLTTVGWVLMEAAEEGGEFTLKHWAGLVLGLGFAVDSAMARHNATTVVYTPPGIPGRDMAAATRLAKRIAERTIDPDSEDTYDSSPRQ